MTQYPIDIYAQWLRRFLAYLVPTGVRLLLPVALHPRQGRPARPAAHRPVHRRRSSRSPAPASPGSPGASPSGTTGEPADDRGRGAAKEFVAARRPLPARARRTVEAVRDISFRVERGELLGYLGPNGAGKSTTVKMLIGILVPTSGHVRVAGLEPSRQRIELARRLGAMFGQRIQLWWDLPLIDSFELLRHIYRSPGRPVPPEPGALPRGARPRPVPAHAGAPALARAAHPRRADRGDAARAGAALPRRADDRARRRRQAARARRSCRRSTASAASPCS